MTRLANLGAMLAHALDGRTLAAATRCVADDLIAKAPGSMSLQDYVSSAGYAHAAACGAVRYLIKEVRAEAGGMGLLAPKLVLYALRKADRAALIAKQHGSGRWHDEALKEVEHWQRAAAAYATGDTTPRPFVREA